MATKIVAVYAVFSVLWVGIGDRLVAAFSPDIRVFALISVAKGWLFIALTSLLLFLLLRRVLAAWSSWERELRENEESLNFVLEGGQLGFWDWNFQTNHVKRNRIWAEMLGYPFEEIEFTTRQWTDFIHPDDRDRVWHSIHSVLNGQKAMHELTYRLRTSDGGYKWVLDRARVVQRDAQGQPIRLCGTHTDVDKLKRAEQALEDSEQRFRGIFENAAIGIAQIGLDGGLLNFNDAFCTIIGHRREELERPGSMAEPFSLRVDLDITRQDLNRLFEGQVACLEIEKRYLRCDAEPVWVHLSASLVSDADGQPQYIISTFQNITARKKLQEELEVQARLDGLTGVNNRRYFLERSVIELSRSARYGNPLSLLMIDIDHFKHVNDTWGHKAGDSVLQRLGHVFRDGLREVDIIGRMGGEEFAILLPMTGSLRAVEVAERLRTHVAGCLIEVDSTLTLSVTISVGVSTLQATEGSIDALLSKADQGLYLAKANGRNRVVC
ncbi:sensor domain-containing diguanylate cyclase [Paludibacterium yongneupense]|uniref:sensor domain-containing diguanylate cyclase n=1 Tax=Paludibacterium yongneupense TaxID=400061 RepID=UPI0004129EA3|nr:sensor domain-containing diguanylate cyclase [Paludibacterium yongneupense]